jgi:hypothetical protein
METWWEDPIDGVYGTHWLTPAWWAPTSDVVWDAYRYGRDSPFFPTTGQPDAENGFGIVSQENVDSWGNEVSTNPWWWLYDQVPIGKHVWIQGWARLWY